MTIRHLTVFDCVCRCGNITKAAGELYVTQPAVSSTIAEIEKHYGISLFTRVNQRIVLTDEGRNVWIKAQEVLSSFKEFEQTALSVQTKPSLNIGATFTIGKLYIPSLIAAVKRNYPNANIHVTINQATSLEEKIVCGALDFAFLEGTPVFRNLKEIAFGKDRLIVATGSTYPIASQVTLDELAKHPLLLREGGSASSEFLKNVFEIAHLRPDIFMESGSNEALISCAVGNLGVIALPERLLKSALDAGELKEITVNGVSFSRTYHAVTHKNRRFSRSMQEIYDFCVNCATELMQNF